MKLAFFSERTPAARIFLGCLLLLIVIIPFDEGGNGYAAQAYTQILLLICGLLWGMQTLRRKELRLCVDPLDWFVAAGLFWLIVNSFLSPYRYAALLELIKICSYLAVFYLCRQLLPLHRLRQSLLFTIFSSSILQMTLAWIWFLTERRSFLQADFVNPNNFACFLVFGVNIGFSFLLFAAPQHSRRYSHALKIVVGVLVCCLSWTIIQGGSRGAALAFLGSGFFVFSLKKQRLALIFLLICCIAIFLPISGKSTFERLQKRSDQFSYERFGIWSSSLRMALDFPIKGVGLAQFQYVATAYNFPVEHGVARYGKNINSAHNDILQIFAELGLLGLIPALGSLGLMCSYAIRCFRRTPRSWTSVATFAVLLGFLIQSSFSYLLSSPALAFILTFMGILILNTKPSPPPKILAFPASKLWGLLVCVVAAYILLYAIIYPLLAHRQYLHYERAMEEKDILRALPHLQSALEWVPIHPLYHYALGSLYLDVFKKAPQQDLFDKAEDALDTAIRYNPRNYKYYETRAILYKELFDTLSPQPATAEKALREYDLAIQHNPFSPFLLFSKAIIHADIDQFDMALELLRQAVAVEPNFVGGHQMIGKILAHLGRETEAESAFQEAAEIQRRHAARATESHYTYTLLRALK